MPARFYHKSAQSKNPTRQGPRVSRKCRGYQAEIRYALLAFSKSARLPFASLLALPSAPFCKSARIYSQVRASLQMDYLSQLRARASIERAGGTFARESAPVSSRTFVLVTKTVSRRSAKSQVGRQLKVRNWQINAKHFN